MPCRNEEPSLLPRRSIRDRGPNQKYDDNVYTSCTLALLVLDLICFEEAANESKWFKARKRSYWLVRKIKLGIW